MFPKPSYGSYYKFLVSVGMIIVALAIAIPMLLVRESFDFLVTEPEMSELTDVAQEALTRRQGLGLLLTKVAPVGSLILGLGGALLTIWALRQWSRRQGVQDEFEDTALLRAKIEVRGLTGEEVQSKREDEADEVIADSPPETTTETTTPLQRRRDLLVRLASLEREVAEGLALVENYRLDVGVQLEVGPLREQVDFVLLSQRFDAPDLLVEVKYVTQEKVVWNRFRELGALLERVRLLYQQSTGRTARGLGIVVVAAEAHERGLAALDRAHAETTLLQQRVTYAVLLETALSNMTKDDWTSIAMGEWQTSSIKSEPA